MWRVLSVDSTANPQTVSLFYFQNGSIGVVNANFHSGARVERDEMQGKGIAAYVVPSNSREDR